MNKKISIVAVAALVVVVAALTWPPPVAMAQTVPVVECKSVMGGSQSKWQKVYQDWLTQGKTNFEANPAGVCAW